jgi:hypothetical protein
MATLGYPYQLTLSIEVEVEIEDTLRTALGLVTRYYSLSEGCCLKVAVLFLWSAFSDERRAILTRPFYDNSADGPYRSRSSELWGTASTSTIDISES